MKKLIVSIIFVLTTNIIQAQWESTSMPDYIITSIATNGNTIFAGTRSNGMFISNDNGTTWSQVTNGIPNNKKVSTVAVSGNNIFAGVFGSGVFLSQDNGITWVLKNNGITNLNIQVIVFNGSSVFAGTYQGGVFRSNDNGNLWTSVNNGIPTPISYQNIESLAANGIEIFLGFDPIDGQGIYVSQNNGDTWVQSSNGLPSGFNEFPALLINGSTIFAGSTYKGLFRSLNNGANWITAQNGINNLEITSLSMSGTNIFTGTFGNGVFLSENNGDYWMAMNYGLTCLNIWSLGINDNYLFAGCGGVFRYPLSSVGINIPYEQTRYQIFPNPNYGSFTIKTTKEIQSIKILNNLGITILAKSKFEQCQEIPINIENYAQGLYILQIMSNNEIYSAKILVK